MNKSAIVVGAVRSGSGKTSITLGLIRAYTSMGYKVSALKIGPDFLDPSHYKNAGAIYVRNIDPIMQGTKYKNVYQEALSKSDIVILEGVMGFFDSPFPGSIRNSTSDIAKKLNVPTVLVLDGASCAQSIAAEAVGIKSLYKSGKITGVILNNVASPRHAELSESGIKTLTNIQLIGTIYRNSFTTMPSRHLGLIPAGEQKKNDYRTVANVIKKSVNLKSLKDKSKVTYKEIKHNSEENKKISITIAIAKDEAFSFYYPEFIEYFQNNCQRVVFFSPLNDRSVPLADLYIFGGGFPEVYAEKLSKNKQILDALRLLFRSDAKCYAECGGLMYLSKKILTTDGKIHKMVGTLNGTCKMHKRRQALGYVESVATRATLFLEKGDKVVGHEYHWSSLSPAKYLKPIFRQTKIGDRKMIWKGGWNSKNVYTSYVHLSPLANQNFFSKLINWSNPSK